MLSKDFTKMSRDELKTFKKLALVIGHTPYITNNYMTNQALQDSHHPPRRHRQN
jgi:hypothetical protein